MPAYLSSFVHGTNISIRILLCPATTCTNLHIFPSPVILPRSIVTLKHIIPFIPNIIPTCLKLSNNNLNKFAQKIFIWLIILFIPIRKEKKKRTNNNNNNKEKEARIRTPVKFNPPLMKRDYVDGARGIPRVLNELFVEDLTRRFLILFPRITQWFRIPPRIQPLPLSNTSR